MRVLRSFSMLAVMAMLMAMLAVACGGASPGTSNQATPRVTATSGAVGTLAPITPTGGGDTGVNGSITYQISGAYTDSGVFPFMPVGLSVFDTAHSGWVAYFGTDSGDKLIQLTTLSSEEVLNYTGPNTSILGTSDPGSGTGCTFTLTKNDASGLAGSVACTSALVTSTDGTVNRAAINATWDAHP